MQLKKFTQKDRYGNQTSYEFEGDTKPLDPTALMKAQMELSQPDLEMTMMSIPPVMGEEFVQGDPNNHPGHPKGSDTVPAWLTPGEFVVNKEATEMFGPQIEAMNEVGRMAKGGEIPQYHANGAQVRESAAKIMQGMSPADIVRMLGEVGNAYQYLGPAVGMEDGGWISKVWNSMFSGDEEPPKVPPQYVKYDQPMEGRSRDVTLDMPMPMLPDDYLVRAREGSEDQVYIDSRGNPTIGIGHKLDDTYQEGEQPFSQEELDMLYKEDLDLARRGARENIGPKTFDGLNRQQQAALTSMAFQLGKGGQKKFKKMIEAVRRGDHEAAALEALTGSEGGKSKWLKQTPKRALDVAMAFSPDVAAQYKAAGGVIYAEEGMSPFEQAQSHYMETGDPQFLALMEQLAGTKPQGTFVPSADMSHDAVPEPTEWSIPTPLEAVSEMINTEPVPPQMAEADEDAWFKPEDIPQISQSKVDNNEKAIARATEVLADTPTDSPYYDRRLENLRNLQDQQEEDRGKLAERESIEAEKDAAAAAEKAGELRRREEDLRAAGQHEAADEVAGKAEEAEGNTGLQENKDVGDAFVKSVLDDNTASDTPESPAGESPAANGAGTGKSDAEIQSAGEQAAINDPTITEQVRGMMTETFGNEIGGALGSFFNAGELAKMAVWVAGSMAFGATPMQALSFGMEKYIGGLSAEQAAAANAAANKSKNVFELTKSAKYTTDSIDKYARTGNIRDLKLVEDGKSSIPKLTNTKVHVPNLGLQKVWEDAAGTQFYQDPKTGEPVPLYGSGATIYDASTMGSPAIKEEFSNYASSAAGVLNQGVKEGEAGHVAINKVKIGNEANQLFQDTIRDSNIPVADADALRVEVGAAIDDYLAAEQAHAADPKEVPKPTSLKPFFDARMISIKTGVTNSLVLGTSVKEQNKLNTKIKGEIGKDASNTEYQAVWQKGQAVWASMSAEEKKKYDKAAGPGLNGFTYFLNKLIDDDPDAMKFNDRLG